MTASLVLYDDPNTSDVIQTDTYKINIYKRKQQKHQKIYVSDHTLGDSKVFWNIFHAQ